MNFVFGLIAMFAGLGCLVLFLTAPSTAMNTPSYPIYALIGAVVFLISAIVFFYRHFFFVKGNAENEG